MSKAANCRSKSRRSHARRQLLVESLEQRQLMATFGIEKMADAREVWNHDSANNPAQQGIFRVYRDSSGSALTQALSVNVTQGSGFTSADGSFSPALTLNASSPNTTARTLNVSFAAGVNYADVAFTPSDDSIWEMDETLSISLNDSAGYTVDNAKRAATMTLTDWDRPVVWMHGLNVTQPFDTATPTWDAINAGDPNQMGIKQVAVLAEGQSGRLWFSRFPGAT